MPSSLTATLIRCIGIGAIVIGSLALLAIGVLMTAGVAIRFSGGVITGGAEISEMLVIVMAAMSLVAATAFESHPHMPIVIERLTAPTRRRLAIVVGTLAAAFWGTAAFMTARIAIENARVVEETELLRISVIPFRAIWTLALLLITVILLIRVFTPPNNATNVAGPGH